MLRAWLAVALIVPVVLAGCTGGIGGALSLNQATLDDPSFDLSPESGGKETVFRVDSRGLGDKYDVTWDWGDGTQSTGGSAEHKYGFTNGVMTITLIATSKDGEQGIATRQVTLGTGVNKDPTVTVRAQKTWIEVGQTINVTASGRDGDSDPLTYAWTHKAVDAPAETTLEGKASRQPVAFDAPGKYVVTVRALDPKGGEATANVTIDVSTSIPSTRFEETFTGKIVAGTAGAGASEALWLASPPAPDTNVDSTRHSYTLLYPGNTFIFLTWNDTSTQGVFDLDLELRASNGTTVFKSETRAPAAPFEFNLTQQPPGEYVVIVRGFAGADVTYHLLVQSSLQITPELVARNGG